MRRRQTGRMRLGRSRKNSTILNDCSNTEQQLKPKLTPDPKGKSMAVAPCCPLKNERQ